MELQDPNIHSLLYSTYKSMYYSISIRFGYSIVQLSFDSFEKKEYLNL